MTNIILNSGNQPFLFGGGLGLYQAVVAPPVQVVTGVLPTSNLVGRWNVTTLAAGAGTSTITDSSGANRNATTSPSGKVYARQAGTIPGMYSEKGPFTFTPMHPYIQDYAVNVASVPVGAGQAFSVFLVWSRPKQRQPDLGAVSTADVSLLKIGGVDVISLTSIGDGTDTLKLFPAGSPVTGGALKLRHTHAMRVVFSGTTVDVWLDGTKVISGAANQITLGATAALSFINAAHCIFHEAAAYSKTLTTAENNEITAYQSRYPLGERRAAFGVFIGQSNAGNFVTFNAHLTLNRAIAYWTGMISSTLLFANGPIAGGTTLVSGRGIYDGGNALFLNSSSGAANVANWPLGTDGNNVMTSLDSLTPDHKANLRYIGWFWSESDSAMLTYADKATYTAAMKRVFSLMRARLGMSAAQLPVLVINALPFSSAVGNQTHREVMQDLVDDATLNCHFMLENSADALGQGAVWDSSTGQETTAGNSAHRDSPAMQSYAHRMAVPISRALMAANSSAGTSDTIAVMHAATPVAPGPRIVSASYEGTAYATTGTVLVTVAHDGGNDLVVPLRGALGVGWKLMDGVSASVSGTPGAPGALISATACSKVSPTQLRVTLASIPSFPTKAKLHYAYGGNLLTGFYSEIGRGNAVTDNFSTIVLPDGWKIAADLGAAYQPDFPLHATTYGVALT